MADDKKGPEFIDEATGREIAASGFPAPTTEEALHELGIIQHLLENHGCATTRDLVAAASVAVDVSHKDAHSITPEDLQEVITAFGEKVFTPMQEEIISKAQSFPGWEYQAKFYARMASIFLQLSRVMGKASFDIIREEILKEVPKPQSVSGSPEDAIKKLLDMPTSSYKN